jgi:UDP-N-acetylmuramoylalanine--D-glutamate ligase
MDLSHKKIGIWGYGILGKSALNFFIRKKIGNLQLLEKHPFSTEEQKFFAENNVTVAIENSDSINTFIQNNDIIVPSSGVDLRPYQQYKNKIISELDYFAMHCTKPVIAVTGTIGKTSTTTFIAELLKQDGLRVGLGGNIGVGLFDFIDMQHLYDIFVLELSSFQLEQSTIFAPDLAVWTTFYPNHLDRHATMQEYFAAKTHIFRFQKEGQKALLPIEIVDLLAQPLRESFSFFSLKKLDTAAISINSLFYYDEHDNALFHCHNGETKKIIDCSFIPSYSFMHNWLIAISTLSLMNFAIKQRPITLSSSIDHLEHRLEKVEVINNIAFYNDSKSTVPHATFAAVKKLSQEGPLLLFLGGVSKGIDREPFIKELYGHVKKVFCFGKEAALIHQLCNKYFIPAESFVLLEEAFASCIKYAQQGDIVLFSPSGASFDLFKNYQERGHAFCRLVRNAKGT